MSARKQFQPRKHFFVAILALATFVWLAGCSIHEGRTESGEKKVDIRTPFGDLKVNTDVDVKDTGLPVYPGAQRVTKTDNDKDAANVNISSGAFGLKVVAIKFRSDDPPSKVLDFYRPKMKAFGGKLLECQQQGFVTYNHVDDSKEITCDKGSHLGTNVELKAGTPDRQHIVAVKPVGAGSEFALVYVSKHGKEGM
ncbi:MAG: hypothetical protein LAO06_21375 [Acidobacteriia bacterium]|nr:hypothetical protein [Terriglobia bacterium]